MEVKLHIDRDNIKSSITVNSSSRTPYIENVVTKIKQIFSEEVLNVKDDSGYTSIPILNIERVYTENNKVFCETKDKKIKIKERMYQMKEKLPCDTFFQVSQSEIINRYFIKKFQLTSTGLYKVILKNGITTYASRRCMYILKRNYLK